MWSDLTKCLENFLSALLLSLHAGYNLTSSQPTFGQSGPGSDTGAMSSGAAGYGGAAAYGSGSFWNSEATTQNNYGNVVSLEGGFSPLSGAANLYASAGITPAPIMTSDISGTNTETNAALVDTTTGKPVTQSIAFDFSKVDFSFLLLALQQIAEQLQNNSRSVTTETPTTTGAPVDAALTNPFGNNYNQLGMNMYSQTGSVSSGNLMATGNSDTTAAATDATNSQALVSVQGSGLSNTGQTLDFSNYGYGFNNPGASAAIQMPASPPTTLPTTTASNIMDHNRRYSSGIPVPPAQLTAPKAFVVANSNGNQLSAGRSGGCGIPAVVRGVPLVLAKMMGGWYEYMNRLPGIRPASNTINVYAPLGFTAVPEINSWGLSTSFSIFQYSGSSSNTAKCVGVFQQANITSDGRKIAKPLLRNTGSDTDRLVYTVLAVDYDTLDLSYRCSKFNVKTGLCDEPYVRLSTRTDPRALNQTTKDYIHTTVNKVLRPFCLSIRDLNIVNWLPLPPCSQDPPMEVTNALQTIRNSLTEQNRFEKTV